MYFVCHYTPSGTMPVTVAFFEPFFFETIIVSYILLICLLAPIMCKENLYFQLTENHATFDRIISVLSNGVFLIPQYTCINCFVL